MDGYIKIFRRIKDWGWYDDPNTLALWVHLLVGANWRDGEWHGGVIPRGSMITSVAKLAADSGLTERGVRTCLARLVKSGEIVMESSNRWTKITVCRYDDYQSSEERECQTDDEQTASIQPIAEEQKETKEKVSYAEAVERIYRMYPSTTKRREGNAVSLKSSKKNKAHIERMLRSGEYTEESLSYAIRRYLDETNKEYLKAFETFLNQVPDFSQVQPGEEENKEDALQRAMHPTDEEIGRQYSLFFLPQHPRGDGESQEDYRMRVRPAWEKFYKAWIDRRVSAVNNKY